MPPVQNSPKHLVHLDLILDSDLTYHLFDQLSKASGLHSNGSPSHLQKQVKCDHFFGGRGVSNLTSGGVSGLLSGKCSGGSDCMSAHLHIPQVVFCRSREGPLLSTCTTTLLGQTGLISPPEHPNGWCTTSFEPMRAAPVFYLCLNRIRLQLAKFHQRAFLWKSAVAE